MAASICTILAAPTAPSSTAGISAISRSTCTTGDQFQVGPVLATLEIGARSKPPPRGKPCPRVGGSGSRNADTDGPGGRVPCTELPVPDDLDPALRHRLRPWPVSACTPLPELEDEATLEALRCKLATLFEEPLPRRVVVNLEFVNHLSRQVIALLLAHHFRLEWAGGGLRICQAHARIVALLDQVRLTMLVDCYPTLDEAVLAAHGSASRLHLRLSIETIAIDRLDPVARSTYRNTACPARLENRAAPWERHENVLMITSMCL